ncbi:MAG: DUF2357 domain-containing protein, partial [Methylococcales bacterium]
MTALRFQSDNGSLCQVSLSDPRLPESIAAQLNNPVDVWFEVKGLCFDAENSDILEPSKTPLFFEWQRLEWFFEANELDEFKPPYTLYINNNPDSGVRCNKLGDRYRLMGSVNLGNAVGKTRFEIKDANSKCVFMLGAEVFPQKLDYKDDFPAMLSEVTEVVYSLAFDLFKKTFSSTKTRTTYNQSLSEWLNLYKVLAEGFEKSIDTILRAPKSELKCEHRLKSVDRVKRASHKSISQALKKPDRYCQGGGIEVLPGIKVSHLNEQHKKISFDTRENRFVVWAIKDVIKKIDFLVGEVVDRKWADKQRVNNEVSLLRDYQRKLRFRLRDSVFSDVASFSNQQQFSTTLTMAPGYKEFYYRYLLLRKGLTLSDNELFNMDYKDIATLYEYWCFIKTVKLLRDNPKYDLTTSDIVKIEHNRFTVNLKKGNRSVVCFKQRTTGDDISLYYNRTFSSNKYTHTFNQIPDNFIEFSRSGFGTKKDKKTFKIVLDAKYRFDRGSSEYPDSKTPYGPPLDTISQLHRYRDAILWQQDVDDSIKLANKSLGGVILFPYPNDEMEFKEHPFYKSIEQVNIGAIPLQPGSHRENRLYQNYLDSLFEQSGEEINERRVLYDTRQYATKKKAHNELVMVGLVPKNNRQARLDYHFCKRKFYTQWHKEPKFSLEKVDFIALYDQQTTSIIGWAKVEAIEFMMACDLHTTGTTWQPRNSDIKLCVYNLGEIN